MPPHNTVKRCLDKMIVDRLCNAAQYYSLEPLVRLGFDFLGRPDLASLEDGVHEIQGRDVFAVIARGEGVGREAAMLEAHHKYLDIQYVIAGTDTMGWLEREFVQRIKHAAALFARNAGGIVQIQNGITLPPKFHTLKATGQKARAPKAVVQRLALFSRAIGSHRHEGREIGILAAEPVANPCTHARPARYNRAGLE